MTKLLTRALVPAVGALAVVAATAPSAAAGSFRPCDEYKTEVCYTETGTTNVAYGIPNLAWGGGGTHLGDVAAYLDIYRVPVGTGGVNIPCVTPVENGIERDACAALGFTRVNRTELFTLGLTLDTPQVSGSLVTVYVCTAEVTATVENVGVTDIPTLTVCADNPQTVYDLIPNGW